MLKVATSFSGGLAACEFALKYEDIDHEVVFACEWDKYARSQYLEFHGEPKTFYNDIQELNATKYKNEIDLFVWGSPCQDLSLAGKRKGFDGEKSSLFRQGARVLEEMMPKVFIFENVKGLLSSNNGNDYKEVIKTFQDLGYLISIKVLNAKEHGTAQNRERVFVVGFLNEEEYHRFNFEQPIKLTKALRDYLDDEVEEKYFLSDKLLKGFMSHRERHEKKGTGFKYEVRNLDGVASCLRANGSLAPTDNTVKIKSATKSGYEIATKEDSVNFTHPDSKTRRGRVGKGVAQTLDCSCNQGVIESSRIRKLTPMECYRLMGVRDEDINLVNSDTQSYKIAGNGIEVNTMRSILRSLYKNKKTNSLLDFM